MLEIRISELAGITGFPPSTIRFYEHMGLLPAASRAPRGHRVYTDHDIARLRFIARGKYLGLPLDEIRELVDTWDNGATDTDRARIVANLHSRIAEVDYRVTELSKFLAQLIETLRRADGTPQAE